MVWDKDVTSAFQYAYALLSPLVHSFSVILHTTTSCEKAKTALENLYIQLNHETSSGVRSLLLCPLCPDIFIPDFDWFGLYRKRQDHAKFSLYSAPIFVSS